MHRSGTSAITRGLQSLGIEIGESLLPGIIGENDKGFFEDIDIYKFNTRILDLCNSKWNSIKEIKPIIFRSKRFDTLKIEAKILLKEKIGNNSLYGIKDPRFSRLLPFWQPIFLELKIPVFYLVCFRNPLSVAASLKKRDGIPKDLSLLLWLDYYLEIIDHTKYSKRKFVEFESFLRNPAPALDQISQELEIPFDKNSQNIIDFYSLFLDKKLSHHTADSKSIASLRRSSKLAYDLYQMIFLASGVTNTIGRENGEDFDEAFERLNTSYQRTRSQFDKIDQFWVTQLEQTAKDYELEIKRIGVERDTMLAEKDRSWVTQLEQTAKDYELEIKRIGVERDTMLAEKDQTLRHIVPSVGIVIVNYNGINFLPKLVRSIKTQTITPAEIIIVDNNSHDESVNYIRENFPDITLIESKVNLGFAAGNNLAVAHSKSELIAFINSDTIVENRWLEFLLSTWVSNKVKNIHIGAVAPKIRFLTKFIEFEIASPAHTAGNGDGRTLGVAIDFEKSRVEGCEYIKPIIKEGFYWQESWKGRNHIRWTNGNGKFYLPVNQADLNNKKAIVKIVLRGNQLSRIPISATVSINNKKIQELSIANEFFEHVINLNEYQLRDAKWVINNAGTRLDALGNAADEGINSFDDGQYNEIKEIDAFCGCSFLTSKEIFQKFRGFDESYFMYYEDTDLAWRLKNKKYKIIYDPRSIVRHIHAGSSFEWSPNFRYFVTRNYYINIFKNINMIVWPYFLVKLIRCTIKSIKEIKLKKAFVIRKFGPNNLSCLSDGEITYIALISSLRNSPGILFIRLKSALSNIFKSKI